MQLHNGRYCLMHNFVRQMNASGISFRQLSASTLRRQVGLALLMTCTAASFCDAATTVVGWGDNTASQLQVPAGLTNAVEVAAGDSHSLALKTDGSVVAWGQTP